MPGNGEIFLHQVREAQAADLGVLVTSSYFDRQMPNGEANDASWDEFRRKIKPLGTVVLGSDSDVECLIVPKTVPWGAEDVTIFTGAADRQIIEIDDLTSREGEAFLDFNFGIAEDLVRSGHSDNVQVSIGFNPHDLSAGHHTVLKLHSHIKTVNPTDQMQRQHLSWWSMDRFSRLSFIEPFAPLYDDFIRHAVGNGLFERLAVDAPRAHLGYTSLDLTRSEALPELFDDLKTLYTAMKTEYNTAATIFTDGTLDAATDRFVPRPQTDRYRRLALFLESRQDLYGNTSKAALHYLAKYLTPAALRNHPTDVGRAATMYLSRGFAGGMTFAFEANRESVRFDFLPRVITTSAVTKTMMGPALPTKINKTNTPASDADRGAMHAYHQKIVALLRGRGMKFIER